jgi:hypothetical protein
LRCVDVIKQVGWDGKAGESHTDKLMRASVMELLDSFAWDDAAVAAEAKRRFDGHWEDAALLPSEYKVSVDIAAFCLYGIRCKEMEVRADECQLSCSAGDGVSHRADERWGCRVRGRTQGVHLD